jgi:hypothetical protein
MSDNPFAEAIKASKKPPITRHVEPSKPFFHRAIEQDKLRQQARNMTRQQMFDNGFLTVEDLDDEELLYGKCRDASGRIPRNTKKTEMVPRDLYDEMVAEHLSRTQEKFRQQLDTALETMVSVMSDETVEPKDRMEAAKYLMERVIGKPIERVAVSASKEPWEEIALTVGRTTRAEHQAKKAAALDVEVVEDDVRDGADNVDQPDMAAERRVPTGYQDDVEPDVDTGGAHTARTDWEHPTFAPHPEAPSYTQPATNAPVPMPPLVVEGTPLSDQLRAAQAEQQRIAEARAARKKLINDAKAKRKAKRAMGADVLAKNLVGVDFDNAQDRFAAHTPNTEDVSGEDTV